jgi:alpha-galactosidase
MQQLHLGHALAAAAALQLLLPLGLAVEPSADELAAAAAQPAPAFSFTYGGRPSAALLRSWKPAGDAACTTWQGPDGFWVRRNVSDFAASHAARVWVLDFGFDGGGRAEILVLPLPADLAWADHSATGPMLHYADGSNQSVADFQPHTLHPLPPAAAPKTFVPRGGRSSDGTMPYWNLESGDAQAMSWMLAVGWTGTWRASFSRTCPGAAGAGCRTAFSAGMNTTRIRLRAGETIRTPAVAQLAYSAATPTGAHRGHNLWRRFMLAELSPRPEDGKGSTLSEMMPRALSSAAMDWNTFNTSNQEDFAHAMHAGFGDSVDTYWMDAGWDGAFPYVQGNWTPDPTRFPPPPGCMHPSCGLEPLAAALKAQGTRYLLWAEPERVMPGTELYAKPEWLLTASLPRDNPTCIGIEGCYMIPDHWRLLDFGNPDAHAWAVERFSGLVKNLSLAIYRQDSNIDPLFYWWTGEATDRQGMTEIKYVTGMYSYWDELQRRHPSLILDSCASGGRRLDFEAMRRMVVLTPSDDMWDDGVSQAQSYGLARWLPLAGAPGSVSPSNYSFRSGMSSSSTQVPSLYNNCGGTTVTACTAAFADWRKELEQWGAVRHLFHQDFYPLTRWSTRTCTPLWANCSQCSQCNMCCPGAPVDAWDEDWIAWQLHSDGDAGAMPVRGHEGLVLAFRRTARQGTPSLSVHLFGLDAGAKYEMWQLWDSAEPAKVVASGSGAEWMTGGGVPLAAGGAPAALVMRYKLVDSG